MDILTVVLVALIALVMAFAAIWLSNNVDFIGDLLD